MSKKTKTPPAKPNPTTHNPTPIQDTPAEAPVIAGIAVRMMAILYDGMLILAMLFLVGTIGAVVGTLLLLDVGTESAHARQLPLWYQNGVMTPLFVLTLIGFYGLFWRKSGQTLGMQTWRLKTVDNMGNLLTWSQSTRRIMSACLLPFLCGVVALVLHGARLSVLLGALFGFVFNYAFCLFNSRGLAVHDILSNSMTLKVPKIEHESLWRSWRKK